MAVAVHELEGHLLARCLAQGGRLSCPNSARIPCTLRVPRVGGSLGFQIREGRRGAPTLGLCPPSSWAAKPRRLCTAAGLAQEPAGPQHVILVKRSKGKGSVSRTRTTETRSSGQRSPFAEKGRKRKGDRRRKMRGKGVGAAPGSTELSWNVSNPRRRPDAASQ